MGSPKMSVTAILLTGVGSGSGDGRGSGVPRFVVCNRELGWAMLLVSNGPWVLWFSVASAVLTVPEDGAMLCSRISTVSEGDVLVDTSPG